MQLARCSKPLTIALACHLVFLSFLGGAAAGAAPSATGAERAQSGYAQSRYFIEFRSRPGFLFGHTFIGYGRLNSDGTAHDIHYAGIYPLDGQEGLIAGSFIPVRASVRGVEEDLSEHPNNIYRRTLTAAQYFRMRFVVRQLRATEHHWHLVFSNCNDFAIKVARQMGMRTPPSLLLPKLFIAELRRLNG